jgi:hypothetical protein
MILEPFDIYWSTVEVGLYIIFPLLIAMLVKKGLR